MNKKIFRSSFLVAVIVLILSLVLVLGVLFDYFERQIQDELKSEALYLSHAIENEGTAFFDDFDSHDKRITLIDKDGTVIADTDVSKDKLNNHLDREEVKEAFDTGFGMSTRYSDTLTEKTIYYAVRLDGGEVLRVSTTQYTIIVILLGLMQPLIIIMVIALLLSAFLSARASKSIIKPINELDLDNPAANDTYEELSPLLSKISAQRRTIDKQLREAKKKQEEFHVITENMSEGFLVIDKDTNILTYNAAALKLLGTEDFKSGSVLQLNRTKDFCKAYEKALSGERAQTEMTLKGRTYNLIANPVFEDKNIIGAVIVIIDITESAEREQLRREFTSNVSHELKTPLTSISGFAEIMKEGGCSAETVVDFSKSIYDESQRLITLVSDIIKLSELDEGAEVLENETVDLYRLSEDIVKRLKMNADKKGVKLSLIGESAKIKGSEKILDEMIYNLLDNAVKYNKENGTADIIISQSDKSVSLTVRDTGIGIPQPHQDRVFERFYRVDKSRSKGVGGTGLGLSIVKHGAIYHNAEISLVSAEDKGTSVTLKFDKA